MTKINRLVMKGFKSFGKHTELQFLDGFNCVLGPNGSGKSNILDALTFVLGRSSTKALRAEKAANLIYNGGKTKKPAHHAEVSIYLDNSKRIFPTEQDEVKISRIVKQNGNSVYLINDEKRTRQQVLELLALANIDPEGYNIILQGDIIKFVEMSPIDRRLLVEEIAGISHYEEKKEKALKELEKVDLKLKEAEIILTERENHLKELKKERDQALKYQELNKRIKVNKATRIYRQIEGKKAEKEEVEERLAKHKERLDALQKQIDEIKAKIEENRTKIDDLNKEIETKGEKEQVLLHREIERLKVDIATSNNRTESLKQEITKIAERNKQLESNLEEINEKIKTLDIEKKGYLERVDVLKKEISQIEAKIIEFKKKNQLDNLGDIEKEIDKIDKNLETKEDEIKKLREQQQELLRTKDKIEFQIQAIDEKIEKVLSIEKENKGVIEELKKKKDEFKKATNELNQKLNRDSEISIEISNARNKIIQLNEELTKVKAKDSINKAYLEQDTALSKILAQKNKIQGIYGTVSELATAPKKYSLALEIAAAQKIKSVVVENDSVAEKCIKYLKENKYGVVTFLPLNKIKEKPVDVKIKALAAHKGVHGLAIDLIKHDPKFKKIFSYVFGNTLIVEDIKTARKIGVGNVKMATLDGDLTELSGAMQGGYRKKTSLLGFSEAETESELRKIEKSLEDNSKIIIRLEKEKDSLEKDITKLRQLKASLEGEIIKIEKSLHLDSADLDASKIQKRDLETQYRKIEKDFENLTQKISEKNKELAEEKIKRQELRNKISELRSPAKIAELNTFEQKRQELKQSIMELYNDIKNIEAQKNNILLPEKERIKKIMTQHIKEQNEFENEIRKLKNEIELKEKELKEKEKAEKKFYEQFRDLFAQRSKLDKENGKLQAKLTEVDTDYRKTEFKMNALNMEKIRVETELGGLNVEFREYEGVEVDMNKSDAMITKEINEFKEMVENMGSVNLKSLEIYEIVEKEYQSLLEKKKRLELEREDVLVMMNEIEAKKKDMFLKTFNALDEEFKKFFTKLTLKGEAFLELENPERPFEGGLKIKVRLTGNKFLDIRGLSGGEKTLTALAFIFAIQEYKPHSFYVFDEVDAALDKKNSEQLAKLIKEYSAKAQYIVITHNDGILSEADVLYGISIDHHGISNAVSLKI